MKFAKFRAGALLTGCLAVSTLALAQETIGTKRDPLVGGTTVDVARQEEFGLLTLQAPTGACSATLLRNAWVITAAHCVEPRGADGRPMPDPNRPGQNIVFAAGSIQLRANWGGVQNRTGASLHTFRPYDVALIQVNTPFAVSGSTEGYSRLLMKDQFPYFGSVSGARVLVFGRGISQFATGSGTSATPSTSDGLYRQGIARVHREESHLYWYPSEGGQMIAGGDSGGPSFAWVLGGYALTGVHALTQATCLVNQTCVPNAWTWISATPEAADAPVSKVVDQIDALMGTLPGLSPEPQPTGPVGTFAPSGPGVASAFIYGVGRDGQLLWYRHDGARTGDGLGHAAAWKGGQQVAVGWRDLLRIFPGGGNVIYGITRTGELLWFEHKGFNTGAGSSSDGAWAGPKVVGVGWQHFRSVFAGSNGVIYAVDNAGRLLWYRHNGFKDGRGLESPGAWSGPRTVGTGWQGFKETFGAGNGLIYGIGPTGNLFWMRHNTHKAGTGSLALKLGSGASGVQQAATRPPLTMNQPLSSASGRIGATTLHAGRWDGPNLVGTGWGSFKTVISSGLDSGAAADDRGVVVYAVGADGKLHWYKHRGYADGSFSWSGPKEVGVGWGDFRDLFALIPRDSDGPR